MPVLEILTRTLPAALTSGAAAGGTGAVVTAATTSSLGTAGLIGGIATALATVGGIAIQYRKVAADNVPALRERLARAEKARREAEDELDAAREETATAERIAYRYKRQVIAMGGNPDAVHAEGAQ